jgi:hypothetical protein
MRIIGPGRDYYDVGSSWDNAPKPVFERVPWTATLIERKGWSVSEGDPRGEVLAPWLARWVVAGWRRPWWEEFVDPVLVGFCGAVRRVWIYEGRPLIHPHEVDRVLSRDRGVAEACRWRGDVPTLHDDPELRPDVEGPNDLSAPAERTAELFRALDTPIFTVRVTGRSAALTANASLQALDIQRLLDPWTAWQRLDVYLSNDLAKQVDPPDAIDDTLRRDIHGFDGGSFRRGPGGPSRKRKK